MEDAQIIDLYWQRDEESPPAGWHKKCSTCGKA